MENKEQKIKMLVTAIGDETNSAESIDEVISNVTSELIVLKEEFDRKHSEALYRYKTLCDAQGSAKKYIENRQKELEELTASDENR